MDPKQKDQILKTIYYDPALGLGSTQALYRQVKSHKISLQYVKNWLSKQETKQIFNTHAKKIYPPIIGEPNDYQCDLMFLSQYKTKNDGYHVIMNFIEVTTRKVYSYPMKNKTKETIAENF